MNDRENGQGKQKTQSDWRDLIELLTNIEAIIHSESQRKIAMGKHALITTLGLTLFVIVFVYLLAIKNLLSSDAIGFLLGTITGYAFSILTKIIEKF